ncbi:MAG: anti-sigma factor [Alphaproteobacteria bacterium]|nr:anti-sigma factor [Alphaproteobacteria bacterium]
MSCNRALEVQSYLDGELDAMAALAVERHIETCADCAALRDHIETIRKAMREVPYHRADPAFHTRLSKTLDREAGPWPRVGSRFWLGAASGFASAAIAAVLMVVVLMPSAQDRIASDVVSAHLRSLMGNHLVDVASENRHTVKPWFDGHVDISPPVADYAAEGFTLIGGRVDYVHGERAAVTVYRHGRHVVDVFAWKNDGAARPGEKTRNGYHLYAWKSGDLFLCAVSDTDPQELKRLAQLINQTAKG